MLFRQGVERQKKDRKSGKSNGTSVGDWVRRFRNKWKKRVWLFDKLVWSIISYGVGVWR